MRSVSERRGLRRMIRCIAAAGMLICTGAQALDGDYDLSWGNAGRLQLDVAAGSDQGRLLLIQPDGKLLMAGTCRYNSQPTMCVTRQLPNGSYDTSFGPANHPGRILFRESLDAGPAALVAGALTPTGAVFVGRTNGGSSRDAALIYRFEGNGVVTATGFSATNDLNTDYLPAGIAVQPDGNLVLLGRLHDLLGATYTFAVSRILADFSNFDTGFGSAGNTRFSFGATGAAEPRALALQRDGKILVAGSYDSQAAIARLLPGGSLDNDSLSGFGSNGRIVMTIGTTSVINAILPDRDGRIIIAGGTYGAVFPGASNDYFVNRLTARGAQDDFFGASCPPPLCHGFPRIVFFSLGGAYYDEAQALALQSDGKILVSGFSTGTSDVSYFSVARLDRYGAFDPAFGSNGMSYGRYGPPNDNHDAASAIAIGNGGIMIGGYSQQATGQEFSFGMAKLQLDSIFVGGME
ncbi:MAG: hypothetical protein ABI411_15785 [Tahibacter sp.]